jgi:hypothetical protein
MLRPQDNVSRETKRLDGIWDFVVDAAVHDHVGDVWYQRTVFVPRGWTGMRTALRFDAATHRATVWVDDVQVLEHEGGYTPFEVDVTHIVRPGESFRLTVVVNNELTWESIPPGTIETKPDGTRRQHYYHDFFNYAGLNRSGWIYATPRAYIADITIVTDIETGCGIVRYGAVVAAQGSSEVRVALLDATGTVVARASNNEGVLRVEQPELWRPGRGYLYQLQTDLVEGDRLVDRYVLPVGIRTVSVKGMQFLINDEPFYFRGFGKHEDLNVRGRGHDDAAMVQDLALFGWMGANSFRTSHYPYAEEVLEHADRLGIVVIDETAAVGLNLGVGGGLRPSSGSTGTRKACSRAIATRSSPPTSCDDVGSAGADGAGRVPQHQCSEQLLARRVPAQHCDGNGAGLIRRHADRGEGRGDHGRHGDVIESDHTDVARNGDSHVAQSGDDPERHLVIESHDGGRGTVHHSVDHAESGLEGRTGNGDLLHLEAESAPGPVDRVATLPGRPRRRRTAEVCQGAMTVALKVVQRLGNGGSGPEEDGRMLTDRSVDEDRRCGTERVEVTMQTPRRDDDEAVHLLGEGPRRPRLLLPVLAGVDEEHVKLGFPGRALDGPHQGCEVGVRDVGDDDRHVAGATRDQSPGGAVGNEAQFSHRGLNSLPGRGRHPRRQVERPRDSRGVDTGARGNIEDRDSLRLPHATRPYTGIRPRRLDP